jgi:hypothetical protein
MALVAPLPKCVSPDAAKRGGVWCRRICARIDLRTAALLTAYVASDPGLDGSELDRLAPLAHLLGMLIKPALASVGGPAAAPAAVLAKQFMTHNDLLFGVGDGAALEEAQLPHVSFQRFTGTH